MRPRILCGAVFDRSARSPLFVVLGAVACSGGSDDAPTPTSTPPAATATIEPSVDARAHRRAGASGERALEHVRKLAVDIGPRVAGTPRTRSQARDYLSSMLESYGYDVEMQDVPVRQHALPARARDAGAAAYTRGVTFAGLAGGRGERAVHRRGHRACRRSSPPVGSRRDRADRAGRPAVLQKAANAAAAGAGAVIIYNNEDGPLAGRRPGRGIPVVGITQADGEALRERLAAGQLEASVIAYRRRTGTAYNVIARPPGVTQCATVTGGHDDSVAVSHGADDNASGSAGVLEVARLAMANAAARRELLRAVRRRRVRALGQQALRRDTVRGRTERDAGMLNLDVVGLPVEMTLIGCEDLVEVARGHAQETGHRRRRPGSVPSGSSSDHASFDAVGVPVVFFYRHDAGHQPTDAIDRIDAERSKTRSASLMQRWPSLPAQDDAFHAASHAAFTRHRARRCARRCPRIGRRLRSLRSRESSSTPTTATTRTRSRLLRACLRSLRRGVRRRIRRRRAGRSRGRPSATLPAELPEAIIIGGSAVLPGGGATYTIQSGDTFSSIAERYDTTVEQIIAANPGVDPRGLVAGDTIRLPEPADGSQPPPPPADEPTTEPEPTEEPAPTNTPEPAPTNTPSPLGQSYIIQSGEAIRGPAAAGVLVQLVLLTTVERQQLAARAPAEVAEQGRRVGVGRRPARVVAVVHDQRRHADVLQAHVAHRLRPLAALRASPMEVSTSPSGPPVLSRAGALAADTVPMLVPTSHTGTARLAAERGDHRAHVLRVGGARAETVEAGWVGRTACRSTTATSSPCAGEARAVADEEVAGEPEPARAEREQPVAAGEEHDGRRGRVGRAHEEERLGHAGPGGDRARVRRRRRRRRPRRASATADARASAAAPPVSRAEAVGAGDVRLVRLELGVEPARAPAEQRRHALARSTPRSRWPWQRLVPMPVRRSRTSCSETVSSSLHRVVELGDDVGVRGAQPLGAARHLAGQLHHPRGSRGRRASTSVSSVSRGEPAGRHLAGDVEPGARLDPRRASSSAPSSVSCARCGSAPRRPSARHHAVAQLLGQAAEARELGAGDGQEAPAGLLAPPCARARRRTRAGPPRTRAGARPRRCRRPRSQRTRGSGSAWRTSPSR